MDTHMLFPLHGKRLHLGVCGSIAAYKAVELMRMWQKARISVSVSLTPAARQFINPLTFSSLGAIPVYTDMFSGQEPFEHLEPAHLCQAMVIAPASAATLARLAHGQADEMLACQVLAFDGPVVLAPAMNPQMWQNPATQHNVRILRDRGFQIVDPSTGLVACNDEGQGKLADIRSIYLAGLKSLIPQDMEGQKVLITLGPTQERWDSVRFWSNDSTGLMGASLAIGAWLRGAEVEAICGPIHLDLPQDGQFHRHNVTSAEQMLEKAKELWPACDAGIFTAAVADFKPESYAGKFKKDMAPDGLSIRFLPNEDILRLLAGQRTAQQKVVGFAAESVETPDALAHAVRRKLLSKGADMVVGNRVVDAFGRNSNRVFVADRHGREEHWAEQSKPDVAWQILSWLLAL